MKRALVAALILSLAALTACTAEADSAPVPTPSVTSAEPAASPSPSPTPEATPTPSPSPSPSDTLDADQTAARDVVNKYFRLINELRKDPERPLQPLADITTGRPQEVVLKGIADSRADQAVQVGDVTWNIQSATRALVKDDAKVVVIQVCTDNTGADMVHQETGESVLSEDRPAFIHWTIDVSTEGPWWKVSAYTNQPVEGCVES